ncbi:universal stress protein [Streptomyces sp. CC219B]|uniref:universal stress protein n=1 Tax=Streptomyces sp. CC219B TaxID=3044574 RepID=UPI0024A848DD|nr:universal stress protein [Streptomyces sp. CC219B]
MERVIIAGVDRSARSRSAADWAAREALLRGLPLWVVHAAAPDAEDTAGRWPYRPEAVAEHVVAELLDRHPGLTSRSVCAAGAPEAALRGAELLVVGLRGEGGHAGIAVGSTASALATGSDGPVVLVPGTLATPGPAHRTDGVVVGVDARAPSDAALDFAFAAAALHGTRLHAVHAWRLPEGAACLPFPVPEATRATWEDHEVQLLADALRPWREKYPGVAVLEDVVLLAPAVALAHASTDAGLVVVGRRSGATARALLGHARCPVAVVPS